MNTFLCQVKIALGFRAYITISVVSCCKKNKLKFLASFDCNICWKTTVLFSKFSICRILLILLLYLLLLFNIIFCITLSAIDKAHAVPVDVGTTINPTRVIDRVTDVEVASKKQLCQLILILR